MGVPAGVRAGVAAFALPLKPFFAADGPGVLSPAQATIVLMSDVA